MDTQEEDAWGDFKSTIDEVADGSAAAAAAAATAVSETSIPPPQEELGAGQEPEEGEAKGKGDSIVGGATPVAAAVEWLATPLSAAAEQDEEEKTFEFKPVIDLMGEPPEVTTGTATPPPQQHQQPCGDFDGGGCSNTTDLLDLLAYPPTAAAATATGSDVSGESMDVFGSSPPLMMAPPPAPAPQPFDTHTSAADAADTDAAGAADSHAAGIVDDVLNPCLEGIERAAGGEDKRGEEEWVGRLLEPVEADRQRGQGDSDDACLPEAAAATTTPTPAAEKSDGEWVDLIGSVGSDLQQGGTGIIDDNDNSSSSSSSSSSGSNNDGFAAETEKAPPAVSDKGLTTAVNRDEQETQSPKALQQGEQQEQLGDPDGGGRDASLTILGSKANGAGNLFSKTDTTAAGAEEEEEKEEGEVEDNLFGRGEAFPLPTIEKSDGKTDPSSGQTYPYNERPEGEEPRQACTDAVTPEPLSAGATPPLREDASGDVAGFSAVETVEAAGAAVQRIETPEEGAGETAVAAAAAEGSESESSLPAAAAAADLEEREGDVGNLSGVVAEHAGITFAVPDAAAAHVLDRRDFGDLTPAADGNVKSDAVSAPPGSVEGSAQGGGDEEKGQQVQGEEENDERSAFEATPTPSSVESQQALEMPPSRPTAEDGNSRVGSAQPPEFPEDIVVGEDCQHWKPEAAAPAQAQEDAVEEEIKDDRPESPDYFAFSEKNVVDEEDSTKGYPETSKPCTLLAKGTEHPPREAPPSSDPAEADDGDGAVGGRQPSDAVVPGSAAAADDELGASRQDETNSGGGEPVGRTDGSDERTSSGCDDVVGMEATPPAVPELVGGVENRRGSWEAFGQATEDSGGVSPKEPVGGADSSGEKTPSHDDHGAVEVSPPAVPEQVGDDGGKEHSSSSSSSSSSWGAFGEALPVVEVAETQPAAAKGAELPAPEPAVAVAEERKIHFEFADAPFVSEEAAEVLPDVAGEAKAVGPAAAVAATDEVEGNGGGEEQLEPESEDDDWGSDFGDFEEAPTPGEMEEPASDTAAAAAAPTVGVGDASIPRPPVDAAAARGAATASERGVPGATPARQMIVSGPHASMAAAAAAAAAAPGGGAEVKGSPASLAVMVAVFARVFVEGGPAVGTAVPRRVLSALSGEVEGSRSSLESLVDLAPLLRQARPSCRHRAHARLNKWTTLCILRGIRPVPDALSLEDGVSGREGRRHASDGGRTTTATAKSERSGGGGGGGNKGSVSPKAQPHPPSASASSPSSSPSSEPTKMPVEVSSRVVPPSSAPLPRPRRRAPPPSRVIPPSSAPPPPPPSVLNKADWTATMPEESPTPDVPSAIAAAAAAVVQKKANSNAERKEEAEEAEEGQEAVVGSQTALVAGAQKADESIPAAGTATAPEDGKPAISAPFPDSSGPSSSLRFSEPSSSSSKPAPVFDDAELVWGEPAVVSLPTPPAAAAGGSSCEDGDSGGGGGGGSGGKGENALQEKKDGVSDVGSPGAGGSGDGGGGDGDGGGGDGSDGGGGDGGCVDGGSSVGVGDSTASRAGVDVTGGDGNDSDWSDDPFDSFQSAPPPPPPPPPATSSSSPLTPSLAAAALSPAATIPLSAPASDDRASSPPPMETSSWNLDFMMAAPAAGSGGGGGGGSGGAGEGRLSPTPGAVGSGATIVADEGKPFDLVSQALAGFGISTTAAAATGNISPQPKDTGAGDLFSAFSGSATMTGPPAGRGLAASGVQVDRSRVGSVDVPDLLRATRLRGGGRRSSRQLSERLSAAAESRLAALPDLSYMLLSQRIRFPIRAAEPMPATDSGGNLFTTGYKNDV